MTSKAKKPKRGKRVKPKPEFEPPSPVTVLAERWLQVTGRFNVQAQVSLEWWALICASYLDTRRSCHNFHFLEELLKQLEIVERRVDDTSAMLFALFFHAIVLDVRASNNEERCVEYFARFCTECRGAVPEDVEARVVGIIRQCKFNGASCRESSSEEAKLFADMRLAILGAQKEKYTDYLRQLRFEFAHLPHDLYCKMRTVELQQLLSRPCLFKSPLFRELYEQRARDNVRYEMTVVAAPQVASSRLTVADVSEVVQFVAAHSRVVGESGRTLDNPLAMNAETVLHAIAMSMELTLAYRDAKRELMCVVLCTRSSENSYTLSSRLEHDIIGENAFVHTVVTHRDHRGRGLATSLLLELLGVLRDHGVKCLCALAWRGSRQVDFLKKQGFVETGAVVDFRDSPAATDDVDADTGSESEDSHDDEEEEGTEGPTAVATTATVEEHPVRTEALSLCPPSPVAAVNKVGVRQPTNAASAGSFAPASSLDASWARALNPLTREALQMRLAL